MIFSVRSCTVRIAAFSLASHLHVLLLLEMVYVVCAFGQEKHLRHMHRYIVPYFHDYRNTNTMKVSGEICIYKQLADESMQLAPQAIT